MRTYLTLLLLALINSIHAQDTTWIAKSLVEGCDKKDAYFYSITTGENNNNQVITIYYLNGNLLTIDPFNEANHDSFDNNIIWYYSNGDTFTTQGFKGRNREGYGKMYFQGNKLGQKALFKNNLVNGPYELYYTSGQLKRKETRVDELLEGEQISYYRNGSIREKGSYKRGRKTGTWTGYQQDGTKLYEYTLNKGDDEPDPYFYLELPKDLNEAENLVFPKLPPELITEINTEKVKADNGDTYHHTSFIFETGKINCIYGSNGDLIQAIHSNTSPALDELYFFFSTNNSKKCKAINFKCGLIAKALVEFELIDQMELAEAIYQAVGVNQLSRFDILDKAEREFDNLFEMRRKLHERDEEIKALKATSAPITAPKNKPDNKGIYTFVEQMPKFPGGEGELFKYIQSNLKFPKVEWEDEPVNTKLILSFVVKKDGSIADVSLLKGNSIFAEEAIRVIKSLPKFEPGIQDGKPVDVYFTLPVVFRYN